MEEDQSIGGEGVVDTAKAERSVWLMKCPLVISKSWQSRAAASDPQSVAKVVLSLDPLRSDDPSAVEFTMEMNGTEKGPRSYSLNMFKDFVPMCILSESNQGRDIAVEGKVEHKFDMKPHNENFEEYGKMCRERTNKSMIKNRQIQVIDNDRGVHMRPMPGLVGLGANNKDKKKTAPVKPAEMKRTRRDRGELEDIMFKLFERKPNWALKQLVQETDQPAQFLKEILNELCVYNKRGANQGTYELKPEYKKAVDSTGTD